ncbi:helix-turn-helix transcriptional regulator [Neorhizobium sp. NCHU2750]|uniref:helix-turn-helix domain-containing protein n=1 Tax=Neorhizobium sp. NCHU2750 TaxID=1825976 RepID=UPI000EB749B0|nr:Cro/Cl family transcriptional regulator [Neorhizobium sp. NCHU2750]
MPTDKTKIDLDEKKVDQRVGENIRHIRLLRGLSQGALAEAAGITFQQVQKYEKGTNRVSASRLVQFSIVLSCSLDDLFEGTKDEMMDGLGIDGKPVSVLSSEATSIALKFDDISDSDIRRRIKALIATLAKSREETEEDELQGA